ncbi:kelch repeat-containing protein [Xanthomonas sp. XNM01]|uniref:Kelch repeat-containing protein n=1 Tax=Xanthomonas sp. XNM01 TaxID=2769289 RepID=UPI001780F995|nr:kelch repeat-containing protein [Xanthomonas sp. XNM01]MBD9370220.1 kelch repeat-containing protein [Xanthomonas sp. XNM01]
MHPFRRAPALLLLSLCAWAAACPAPAAAATGEPAWRSVASANRPAARHENAFVALDGRLYLLGGRGERPLQIFDPATRRWSEGAAPPQELHHLQAVAHDGRLWAIGALTGGFPDEPPVTTVLTYDPASDRWQAGAPLPEGRQRGGGGLVVHEGQFYVIGGLTRGHLGGYVPWADRFDPVSGRWTALPDAPHPRDHFHAAVLDGKLYAAGGRTSSHATGETFSRTIVAVDVYDLAAGTWSTLDAPLPTARAGSATVAHGGRIVVIGGESGSQQLAHAEVEAYDPASGRWTTLAPLPVGRHGTQATLLDGAIHIAAGSGNRGGGPELDDHLVYAPAAD